ncbi:hypothetical protein P4O66_007970, partial [Electrophorus voltai]
DLTPHPSTLGDTEIEQRDQTSSRDVEKQRLLFGMDFWTIVAIVSGGALVLLVLLGVCTCACYIHTRKHRRQRISAPAVNTKGFGVMLTLKQYGNSTISSAKVFGACT